MVLRKRALFVAELGRHSKTKKKGPIFQCINQVPSFRQPRAVQEGQQVLREHLHSTKSLPFVFAELIAANSPFSLATLFRKTRFSAPNFAANLRTLLRYHPINEFEFFLESIGIDYDVLRRYLPRNRFFLSESDSVLGAAFCLSRFGFPWNRLGKLYHEEFSIFSMSSDELSCRLGLLKGRFRLDNLCVVGICLAFPRLLLRYEGGFGDDDGEILRCLKRVSAGFDAGDCVEGNVDAWYELCCKVKVFFDLGCERGKVGEMMCDKKEYFVECSKEVLVQKVEYFSRFGVRKVDVGLFLLHGPEILKLDVETPVISVLRVLKHFGFGPDELMIVSQKYPYVMGRNVMANLPCVMKAIDLHEWCFDKIRTSDGQLLATYSIGSPDEDVDEDFVDGMKRLASSRFPSYMKCRVNFMKRIGYGENGLTIKAMKLLHGNGDELQERFDCLVRLGMAYSSVCLSITTRPRIFDQSPEKLEEKVNFLCGEMGSSVEYIEHFPAVLCFDLDRMKFRCRFFAWLRTTSLIEKNYSVATMVVTSENSLIRKLFGIHPALPKLYLECYSYKRFVK